MSPVLMPAAYGRLCVPHGQSRDRFAHGEDWSFPLVTEVFPLYSFFTHFPSYLVSCLWSFTFIHSLLFPLFLKALQKSVWLIIFGKSTIHIFYAASGSTSSAISHHFCVTSTPTVPIVGVTNMKEAVEATGTSSRVQMTTSVLQKESTPSKHQCIFPMAIPATTQRSSSPSGTLSSSASPPLPIIVVSELAIPPMPILSE